MAWEENSRICLHMQLIAILSRIGVEMVYGICVMGSVNDGDVKFKDLAQAMYQFFGIKAKDCYRFYTDIRRRKNYSRTYFLDKMQEKLNEKMRRDDELERMRR